MPPKKQVWRPKNLPEGWRQATAERLEQRRQAQPQPDTAEQAERALPEAKRMAREAHQRFRESQQTGEPLAPVGDSEVDMVDAAALMTSQREYYRTGPGLTATTFEPQRHTFYVCGRPVQAPCLPPPIMSSTFRMHTRIQSSEPFALLM